MSQRTAMDPQAGDEVMGRSARGVHVHRVVVRTEMHDQVVYYRITKRARLDGDRRVWIESWRAWVRKYDAKILRSGL